MTQINRYRGDTLADEITVTDLNGSALDVTGYTFRMTLDSRRNPPDATTQLYTILGLITDAPGGKVEFQPSLGEVDQIPGTYYYDIQMVDSLGRKQTIAKDKYVYTQDITKT